MSNKRRVCIEVFSRDEQTLIEANRPNPQGMEIYRRYHWAILIRPKNMDKIAMNDLFRRDRRRRPQRPKRRSEPGSRLGVRVRESVNPLATGHFLAAVVIGKLPKGTTNANVRAVLEKVPLPRKDVLPEERCSFWLASAIARFQEVGYVAGARVDGIMRAALKAGNDVLQQGPPERSEDRFLDFLGRS